MEDVTPFDIRYLRNTMSEYSESTLQNYLYNFGSFLKFATGKDTYREARIRFNGIDPDRVWISAGDWKVLYESANVQEKLMLALGASMGLRRTEIVSVRLEDITGDVLRVMGKGTGSGKIVDKDMSDPVKKCLGPYLEWRSELIAKYGDRSDGYLFVCQFKKDLGKPMTVSTIHRIAKNLEERTGIRWTLHSLRRLYCMTMVDAGVDLDTTRRMMRHNSVQTTVNAYIKADPRKMRDAASAVDSTFSAFV